MNLRNKVLALLAENKTIAARLAGVPIPIVEEVVAKTLWALGEAGFPAGTTLEDALDGDAWEQCESCEAILPVEKMEHDVEGVPLCSDCMRECAQGSAP